MGGRLTEANSLPSPPTLIAVLRGGVVRCCWLQCGDAAIVQNCRRFAGAVPPCLWRCSPGSGVLCLLGLWQWRAFRRKHASALAVLSDWPVDALHAWHRLMMKCAFQHRMLWVPSSQPVHVPFVPCGIPCRQWPSDFNPPRESYKDRQAWVSARLAQPNGCNRKAVTGILRTKTIPLPGSSPSAGQQPANPRRACHPLTCALAVIRACSWLPQVGDTVNYTWTGNHGLWGIPWTGKCPEVRHKCCI